MNYARILHIFGTFVMFVSVLLVVPLACSLVHGETDAIPAFLVPACLGWIAGFVLHRRFRSAPRALYRREGLLIVSTCWIGATLVGALPFVISGMIPNYVDACFETMSGLTTTGSTILSGIDELNEGFRGMLFWRAMTHWLGGMGIVLLFVAILPALGVGGRLLYQFEVPGVEQDDLKPRIRETAILLWKIYLALTVLEVLCLLGCGLSLYDSIVHTLATVATGGFSNYDASVKHFDSAAVDVVITVFMFLAGVNFTLYFRARRGDYRVFFTDPEFRAYLGLVLGATLLVGVVLLVDGTYDGVGEAARYSAFQVLAVQTTTGFATADFDAWPNLLRMLFVCLMFIGGSAGSTAGGMKVLRFYLIVKYVGYELRRFIRPHRVSALTVGGHTVPQEVVRNTMAFFALVMLIFVGSSLVMSTMTEDLGTATSSVAATLWNIGPGLNAVGPTENFAHLPAHGKILLTVLMLFGRLEIFTAVAIFMPALYRD